MCDPCAHRAILRAAKSLARSPAARCIDPDAAMPWLPFQADGQRVRTKSLDGSKLPWLAYYAEEQAVRDKAGDLPLHEIEARALEQFVKELRRTYGSLVEDAVRRLERTKLTGRAAMDFLQQNLAASLPLFAQQITAAAGPYLQTIATAGVEQGLAQLARIAPGRLLDASEFDVASRYAIDAAERATARVGNSVFRTVNDHVAGIIRDGIENLDDTRAVIDRLEDAGYNESSAARIARTESARAYTNGQIAAWQETGLITAKRWILSPTSCEFCELVATQFNEGHPLGEPFLKVGDILVDRAGAELEVTYSDVEGPPLHPYCRCGLEAVETVDIA